MENGAKHPLPLAWKTFWKILFPETPNCEETLRDWVMHSLVEFSPDKPFQGLVQTNTTIPGWLNELSISVDLDGARIGRAADPNIIAPWFAHQQIGWKPSWVLGHGAYYCPFVKLVDTPQENRADFEHNSRDCYGALRNATLRIGEHMEKEIRFKLRIGHLQATGIHSGTDAKMDGVEIVSRLNTGFLINVLNNSMSGSGNRPLINELRISKGPFHLTKAKLPASFEEYDIVLFEQMKNMIETRQVPSVRKAAEAVEPLALRRGGQESVIVRLEKGYGRYKNT